LEAEVAAAEAKGFAALRSEHVAEHRSWMTRVDIDWGKTDPAIASLPTDKRLLAYGKGGQDPELESTLYQYGRYLLIGSSRPGCLPANLQGIWNESNHPAWASDYHNNINIQMCYWLAEVSNLSECHLPLTDWIIASVPGCREATRADKRFGSNPRGWTVRTSQNIWGGNGWDWNLPGNAWLVQHSWEHYAFTLDKEFLRTKAYPLLKEVCEFWFGQLKTLPDGRSVIPMGWSPEHGPREDGVAHDQQLIWDLFQNTIEATEALGVDADFRNELKAKQAKLVGPQIGRWGQLMEWMVDRDDPNDHHRHTSQLFAVYPGRQISVQRTPEFAAAAMKSLEARGSVGDSRRSWTWAWRSAMWARFGRGDRVAEMIRGLMTYNMLPNLFANHPPFQLDGNYGIVAGISEALVQSHAGEIVLLPALPKSWPEGHANGLCARGAITIAEMSWKAGRLERAVLVSAIDQTVSVRINGEARQVTLKANQPVEMR
jgi:alpha-L-fucosidase 2